jgi:GNAT superfamily N-acetyltransferase
MIVTYQVENWFDALPEMEQLWPLHWQEIASDRDKVPLEPNYREYAALANLGVTHVVVARHEGRMIGYHVTMVKGHIHYASMLSGFVDMYFMHPDFRRGFAGIGLFRAAEDTLRARGVRKIFTATKVTKDMSIIFRRLGYTHAENLFTKYIGD